MPSLASRSRIASTSPSGIAARSTTPWVLVRPSMSDRTNASRWSMGALASSPRVFNILGAACGLELSRPTIRREWLAIATAASPTSSMRTGGRLRGRRVDTRGALAARSSGSPESGAASARSSRSCSPELGGTDGVFCFGRSPLSPSPGLVSVRRRFGFSIVPPVLVDVPRERAEQLCSKNHGRKRVKAANVRGRRCGYPWSAAWPSRRGYRIGCAT